MDSSVLAQPRLTVHELDRVTVEVRTHLVGHGLDHGGRARSELPHRRVGIQRESKPVHLSPPETGDVQGRFAQGLARDLAVLDHRTARRGGPFDDGNSLPEIGRLRGRLLAGRAGADDHHVESILRPHRASRNSLRGATWRHGGVRRTTRL
jgi:hypothetical protein